MSIQLTSTPPFKHKTRGQGMVEFALVIPLFLVLIFGVLELGRLLLVYSAVFTASREAARYGAAVGTGPNGRPYFQDCRGMKDAAIRIGNLAGLDDGDIIISYDNPDTGKSGITCNDQTSPVIPANDQIELGDRVVVTVHINYEPIVAFLGLPDFNINSTARRTIVRDVMLSDAVAMPMPSQTIDPALHPGLTQTSIAHTATAALTQTAAALTATAEAETPEPACPPPGMLTVGQNMSLTIDNSGASSEIVIDSMVVYWGDMQNKNKKNELKQVQLGGSTIWSGTGHPSPLTLTSWQGNLSARTIPAGESRILRITSSSNMNSISGATWLVRISFSGACTQTIEWQK